jgi:hypothetical protein
MVDAENDKPTVIALREIAEKLVSPVNVDLLQAQLDAAVEFGDELAEDVVAD